MKRALSFGLLAALALSLNACLVPASLAPVPYQGTLAMSGSRTLKVKPKLPALRSLQSTVVPYKPQDIDHLVLQLFVLDGTDELVATDPQGNPLRVSMANNALAIPIQFTNLNANTTYRVRAFAYQSPTESPLTLISDTEASYTDIAVAENDELGILALQVQLVDKSYEGASGETHVALTEGDYSYSGPESFAPITVPEPVYPELAGTVSTYAGNGTTAVVDSYDKMQASFQYPYGIAVASDGTTYVSESGRHIIRRILPSGEVSIYAGADGISGTTNGTLTQARFNSPYGLVLDDDDNLIVAEYGNYRLRKITPEGQVSTFAGSIMGNIDGVGTAARFRYTVRLAKTPAGTLIVPDNPYDLIRTVSPSGEVSHLDLYQTDPATGESTSFTIDGPIGVAVDHQGVIYTCSSLTHRVYRIQPNGETSVLAGSGSSGYTDGTGEGASFNSPSNMEMDRNRNIYITDGNRIRKITPAGIVTTLAGTTTGYLDGQGVNSRFSTSLGMLAFFPDWKLGVVDTGNRRIRVIE